MTTLLMLINSTTNYLPYSGSQNSTTNYLPYSGSQNSTTNYLSYSGSQNSTTSYLPYSGSQNSTTSYLPYSGSQNSTTSYLPYSGSQNSTTKYLPYSGSQNSTTNYLTYSGSQNSTTNYLPYSGSYNSTILMTPPSANISDSCGAAPDVYAARVAVKRNLAAYTCYPGYVLAGSPNNLRCTNGTWKGNLPICNFQNKAIQIDNKPQINNQLQSAPLWLLIILGTVGGCAVLLLLCCMMALCLKCLGCWHLKRGFDEECCSCCSPQNSRTQIDPLNTEENVATLENKTENTVQGKRKSIRKSRFSNQSIVPMKKVSTSSLPPGYRFIEVKRKLAKKPANKWMPHINDVRSCNTSTK
ncbi:CSMD [Mytilus coruscus]|uniref:CSMD n=1 Tax=Mytilus coruscus TaxID=42192 RepID=A0A6J8D0G0_MYTCO|nr:CSMD [Mytilus coruscus]